MPESVDALIIVARHIHLGTGPASARTTSSSQRFKILVLVDDDVRELFLQLKVWSLVQSALHPVDEFGSHRVAEDRPVITEGPDNGSPHTQYWSSSSISSRPLSN